MTDREKCEAFAVKHDVEFVDNGECGFGRPCVGFQKGGKWIDHNPYSMTGNYDLMPEYEDKRLRPDYKTTPDAYHKHDCLAVLVKEEGDKESAITQLAAWVDQLEDIGVSIKRYYTGAVGIQAMFTGTHSYVVYPKDK